MDPSRMLGAADAEIEAVNGRCARCRDHADVRATLLLRMARLAGDEQWEIAEYKRPDRRDITRNSPLNKDPFAPTVRPNRRPEVRAAIMEAMTLDGVGDLHLPQEALYRVRFDPIPQDITRLSFPCRHCHKPRPTTRSVLVAHASQAVSEGRRTIFV